MRIIGVLAVVGVLAAPIAWKFALQDYQKERISTFLDPVAGRARRGVSADSGPHHRRIRRAMGEGIYARERRASCGFSPWHTTTSSSRCSPRSRDLPESSSALGLYLFVILRSLESARLAKDRLGAYLVLGVLASFTFQVIYNITMSAGLAPVKGLTLPLMSYGGSSMIATLAGFGLILNVRMRRFTN